MVLKSDLDFRTAPWPSVSDAAKDCVKRLLTRNSSQRATAAEVLNHPWLTQQGLQSDRPLDNVVIQRMRQVCVTTLLQGAPLACQHALPHAKGSRNVQGCDIACAAPIQEGCVVQTRPLAQSSLLLVAASMWFFPLGTS